MSNARAKAERSKAKDKRQSKPPERPVGKSKKKNRVRPYEVWTRCLRMPFFNDWYRSGRYASLEIAEKVIEKYKREYGFDEEYTIVYRDKKESRVIKRYPVDLHNKNNRGIAKLVRQ